MRKSACLPELKGSWLHLMGVVLLLLLMLLLHDVLQKVSGIIRDHMIIFATR
jgi:hypothetical protein